MVILKPIFFVKNLSLTSQFKGAQRTKQEAKLGLMKMVRALELRPIDQLTSSQQMKILAMRNQPEVRRNMYTSHVISEKEHARWMKGIDSDDTREFFGVFLEDDLIGAVSLNEISPENHRADWAFYLDAERQGGGIGSALEFKFLEYAFERLEKLNCEVLAFNQPVIGLHKKFGFKEEGVRRRHIERGEECHDAVLLGITADEWRASRAKLMEGAFRD